MLQKFLLIIVPVLIKLTFCDNVIDLCVHDAQLQCMCSITGEDFPVYDIDCSRSNITFNQTNYTLPENVNYLDFSSNHVSDVSVLSFLGGHKVKKLCLNNNNIKTVNSNLIYLPELMYLDLSDNLIQKIDALFFKYLPKLKFIDLSGNLITNIELKTFNTVPNLNELYLNGNPLGDELTKYSLFQNKGLGINPAIEILSLDDVGLSILPENFLVDAYNLRHLSLERNNLTSIQELPFTLECLSLSDNPIKEIDADDFANIKTLKELQLNNLQLKKIDDYTFADLRNLVKLELKGNRNMTSFSKLAFGDDVLEDPEDFTLLVLSFRGSGLRTLDEELFQPFARLTSLDLQGNPWNCDCNISWLKRFNIDYSLTEHVRCYRPYFAYNYKLFELPDEYFRCPHRYTLGQVLLLFFVLASTTFLVTLGFWLVFIRPKFSHTKTLVQNMMGVSSPYSRIVTEPNIAEDFIDRKGRFSFRSL